MEIDNGKIKASFNLIEGTKFILSHPIYSAKVKFITNELNKFIEIEKSKYPEELIEMNWKIRDGKVPEYDTADCKQQADDFIQDATEMSNLINKYKDKLLELIAAKIEKELKIK